MKLLILLLSFPTLLTAQSRFVSTKLTQNTVDLVDDSVTNSTNYSRTGSDGTWSFSSDGLTTSGSGTGSVYADNFVEYSNWFTNLEKSIYEVYFIPNTDGNYAGVGLIYHARAGGYGGYAAKVALSGANKGRIYINSISAPDGYEANLVNSGSNYFPITNGQKYSILLRRQGDSMYCIIRDVASGATMSVSYGLSYVFANVSGWTTGRPAIFSWGGSQTFYRLREYSSINISPDALFIGDSNMQGVGAGTWYNRYFDKLQLYFKDRIELEAGNGNTTADVVNELPEIVKINPKHAIINIGTNAFTSANLDTIVNVLVRNGILVTLITILPTISSNNPNNSIIRAKAGTPGVTVIDNEAAMDNGYSGLDPAFSDPSSPVHLSPAGNQQFYLTLITPLSAFLTPR